MISAKLPTSSAAGASTITRGNGGRRRSTSVSRDSPLRSTARAAALRTPGGTSIGISTCPWRSAITGPNWRSATRIVTWARPPVWKGNTVDPSSAIRVAQCSRAAP